MVVAWGVNLIAKTKATLFGGSVTLVGFAIAYAVRRGWIGGHRAGFIEAEAAERAAGELETAIEVVTLEEALEMKAMYPSTTLVAVRAANLRLFQEALARARGAGDQAVYVIFVDEVPGLFFPPKAGPSREAREVLQAAVDYFRQAGFTAVPIWRMAHDAGASVAGAARKLGDGGGDGRDVAAQRRLAFAARQRAQVAGARAAADDAGLDLQLSGRMRSREGSPSHSRSSTPRSGRTSRPRGLNRRRSRFASSSIWLTQRMRFASTCSSACWAACSTSLERADEGTRDVPTGAGGGAATRVPRNPPWTWRGTCWRTST